MQRQVAIHPAIRIFRHFSIKPRPKNSISMPGKIVIRPSGERGHANHGWLNTHHTFSFASYYDNRYDGFGRLRVLNEDIVQPKTGFGTHPHREYEIFSYIINGELEHRDCKCVVIIKISLSITIIIIAALTDPNRYYVIQPIKQ